MRAYSTYIHVPNGLIFIILFTSEYTINLFHLYILLSMFMEKKKKRHLVEISNK